MWARVVEFMLGCWLAISPFVFKHGDGETAMWLTDWIAAALVIACALLSYWRPTRHAHFGTLLVAVGLVLMGRFSDSSPLSPALQNEITTGLLLVMFAIIPNEASQPPEAWRMANERHIAE